jgi:hypothetical protein
MKHVNIPGLPPITVETAPGQMHDGHRLPPGVAYGHFMHTRTPSDGMAVDCFVKSPYLSERVIVIHGTDEDGSSEPKCFVGFSANEAQRTYRSTYPDRTINHVTSLAADTFASWLRAHAVHGAEEYQAGGAVEIPATEPTAASFFGDYLPAAQHLLGGDQGVDAFMGHYRGGAVQSSSM